MDDGKKYHDRHLNYLRNPESSSGEGRKILIIVTDEIRSLHNLLRSIELPAFRPMHNLDYSLKKIFFVEKLECKRFEGYRTQTKRPRRCICKGSLECNALLYSKLTKLPFVRVLT
ncbi:hypothetical protein LOAG_08059 [Loa loa]|uniref:Uncharacterized protein n=1 Tax=Loa loa TaxID=7209 RepID=A0A1S0TW73_LOALO|nr:hypothetical protein LOAG_08059 [Loa loa]EFO20436.1 hypothetical protein LOAG_08059 [Loa loa]